MNIQITPSPRPEDKPIGGGMECLAKRVYDASCMTTFLTCPVKFRNQYVWGWDYMDEPVARFFGNVMHEVLDVWYRTHNIESALVELHHLPEKVDSPAHTRERGEVLMREYVDHWGQDSQWEVLDVENEFILPMVNGASYSGRMDLVVREGEQIYIVDHKTMSRMGSFLHGAFRPNLQMDGYAYACQRLYGRCDGVYVNGLSTAANPKERFARDFSPRTAHELHRFGDQFWYISDMIENAIQQEHWLYSTIKDHCNGYGGCMFTDTCVHGESEAIFRSRFRKRGED